MKKKSKIVFSADFLISLTIFIVALNTNIDKHIDFSEGNKDYKEIMIAILIFGLLAVKIFTFETIIKKIEKIEKVKIYNKLFYTVTIFVIAFEGHNVDTVRGMIVFASIMAMIECISFMSNIMRMNQERQT